MAPTSTLRQFIQFLKNDAEKVNALDDLYISIPNTRTLIFCGTPSKTIWLVSQMTRKEFDVSHIHAAMPRAERDSIVENFPGGSTLLLIAPSDLAGEIPVAKMPLIINFDWDSGVEGYGKTVGSLERMGVVINYASPGDEAAKVEIERRYGFEFEDMPSDVADLF